MNKQIIGGGKQKIGDEDRIEQAQRGLQHFVEESTCNIKRRDLNRHNSLTFGCYICSRCHCNKQNAIRI